MSVNRVTKSFILDIGQSAYIGRCQNRKKKGSEVRDDPEERQEIVWSGEKR